MNKLLITAVALLISFSGIAQYDPADYFRLDVRRYQESGQTYLGVSPDIRADAQDTIGRAMHRFPRRFRYLLFQTTFQDRYEKYYPDTERINRLYTDTLKRSQRFMTAFRAMTTPFIHPNVKKPAYTQAELMKVAARFFYVDGWNADASIRSYICIAMNGVKSAKFTKDMTLPEAFCFEAIFENYRDSSGKPRPFVARFKNHIAKAQRQFPAVSAGDAQALENIRGYCYAAMEKDVSLAETLMQYYQLHKQTLGFRITGY